MKKQYIFGFAISAMLMACGGPEGTGFDEGLESPEVDTTSNAVSWGQISADPRVVRVCSGFATKGTTEICWSGPSNSRITVTNNGGPEKLFAGGSRGCQNAGWIVPGHSYVFRLWSGTTLLDATYVTGTWKTCDVCELHPEACCDPRTELCP